MYDVVIIGAGVSGTAIARELSAYKGNFLVLEKGGDVCVGTSKANSGIVHGGYDANENSLMAELNVKGNKMMEKLSKELGFPFKKIGSLVVAFREEDMDKLVKLKERGLKNGVCGLEIINRDKLRELEPNISKEAFAALYCSEAGIVDPFLLNIAMAENAAQNGVEFRFNQRVENIKSIDGGYEIVTDVETIQSVAVVNAAGVFADDIHNMVSDNKIEIRPRKGEYFLLDKEANGIVNHVMFQLPTEKGKGILATPTIDGNVLLGPTSTFIDDKENNQTTSDELNYIRKDTQKFIENIPFGSVITSFTGLRAATDNHEFIIGEVDGKEGFYDVAGMESPGLTSAPAVGEKVSRMIAEKYNFEKNEDFIAKRKPIVYTRDLSFEEHQKLIEQDERYGNMVCRCEKVTEGEIVDSINRILGAKTIDGIKRRLRATAGRCQGGFCTPKIIEILARELKIDETEVLKSGKNSNLIVGKRGDI
ncbi:glycerol-3-phosphate dehydrogenase [Peptoniphilus asaccharolyticus DSM 20463]|uniref:Glycerol-3-phosphate dehydrogenase n=1 Tax=Peptoniphilus asaccharolyticus DSM 20463 TaxID=573058 RepID=A0A1W1V6S9_PEPAS|nr:NAD(P)/FAD-dependent oxidoreductase [Peptoniphilus asaccharolyticus]MBL7575968.1 NAD(P)/FAD-dependent oxidoreductase [Peptoniphilus asaccharolyticus]SMB89052.1 glycerol-3-phosphate dehydrogenase [Peptoniphilus asaccharolyticus DSM 20463]